MPSRTPLDAPKCPPGPPWTAQKALPKHLALDFLSEEVSSYLFGCRPAAPKGKTSKEVVAPGCITTLPTHPSYLIQDCRHHPCWGAAVSARSAF